MNTITEARLLIIPFAVLEWYVVASFALYWNLRPRFIYRIFGQLITLGCCLGFLSLELNAYGLLTEYHWGLDYVYFSESFFEKIVSAAILITITYRQEKVRTYEKRMTPFDSLQLEGAPISLTGWGTRGW